MDAMDIGYSIVSRASLMVYGLLAARHAFAVHLHQFPAQHNSRMVLQHPVEFPSTGYSAGAQQPATSKGKGELLQERALEGRLAQEQPAPPGPSKPQTDVEAQSVKSVTPPRAPTDLR